MGNNIRMKKVACVLLLAFGVQFAVADEPVAENLWPEGAPGAAEVENKERIENRKHQQNELGLNRSISAVTVPTVAFYPAEKDKNTGAAVVICPGGGYSRVVIDKEGHDVARRLSAAGITGVVLKYRNPRPDISGDLEPWPLQDVKRAIRLVRSRAEELDIDPDKVGVMGFSAGGHLAASASVHGDNGEGKSADPVSRQPSRPSFSCLVYPVITFDAKVGHGGSRGNLLGKTATPERIELFSCERQVNSSTPPAFLVHAKDDGVKVENSLLYAEALKKNGVKHELLIFEKGGHGFGLGLSGGEPAAWPDKFIAWVKENFSR